MDLPPFLRRAGADDIDQVMACVRQALASYRRGGKRWSMKMMRAKKWRSPHSAVAFGRRSA